MDLNADASLDGSFKSLSDSTDLIESSVAEIVPSANDNIFFKDQLSLFEMIARLKQTLLEKDEVISQLQIKLNPVPASSCSEHISLLEKISSLEKEIRLRDEIIDRLQSQLDEVVKVNSRPRRKISSPISTQTEPSDFALVTLLLKLQARLDKLEEKFMDWEEDTMHEMFIRVFRPESGVVRSNCKPASGLPTTVPPPSNLQNKDPVSLPSSVAHRKSNLSVFQDRVHPPSNLESSAIIPIGQSSPPVSPLVADNGSVESHAIVTIAQSSSPIVPLVPDNGAASTTQAPPRVINLSGSSSDIVPAAPTVPYQCNNVQSVLLFGDSIIKHINCQHRNIRFKKECHRGASISVISDRVNQLSIEPVDVIYVHCGTNSLKINNVSFISNSEVVLKDFNELFTNLKNCFASTKIVISGILSRRDICFESLCCLNSFISSLCQTYGFSFIDPNSWLSPSCLGKDGLHLNRKGSATLSKHIVQCSENFFANQKN